MTCKDCVHYELCAEQDAMLGENTIDEIVGVEKHCEYFKPKSRFVELPCEVGQKVYSVDGQELTIISIHILVDRYEKTDYKFDCQYRINNGIYPYYFSHYNIGKTIFLTREEAEKALKERLKQ